MQGAYSFSFIGILVAATLSPVVDSDIGIIVIALLVVTQLRTCHRSFNYQREPDGTSRLR